MKQNVKGHDITARYGGEFVIALPNTTLRSAITVADHNHRAVMAKELMKRSSGERLGRVTISIGVALLRTDDTSQSLIERADNRLYAAKRQRRDRVICETDPEANCANPEAAPPARVRSHHCEIVRATTHRWPARAGLIRRSRTPRSGSDC
jgi:diguanylate cyclase